MTDQTNTTTGDKPRDNGADASPCGCGDMAEMMASCCETMKDQCGTMMQAAMKNMCCGPKTSEPADKT